MGDGIADQTKFEALLYDVREFSYERDNLYREAGKALERFRQALAEDDAAAMVKPTIYNMMGKYTFKLCHLACQVEQELIRRANMIFELNPLSSRLEDPICCELEDIPAAPPEENAHRQISSTAETAWRELGEFLCLACLGAESSFNKLASGYGKNKERLGDGKWLEELESRFIQLGREETLHRQEMAQFAQYLNGIAEYVKRLCENGDGDSTMGRGRVLRK